MPVVFIPPALRTLTGGVDRVEVEADDVEQAVAAADRSFPGFAAAMLDDGRLRAGYQPVVDGAFQSRGLAARLAPESELHFLPALGGG